MLSKFNPTQLRGLPVFVYVCALAALRDTCAVGPSAVNVVIRSPLLSNLVGVNEDDHHRDQADEGHQHRRAQSRVDVRDEAPKGGKKDDVTDAWNSCSDENGGGCEREEKQNRSRSRGLLCSIFVVERLSLFIGRVSQTGPVWCKYWGWHKFHTTLTQPFRRATLTI